MEQNPDVSITTSAASIPSEHISTPSRPVEQVITISEQLSAEESEGEEKHWIEKKRIIVIMVAVLVISLAIKATYNPPGGNWKHNNGTHRAGHAILADNHPAFYQAFVAANATSIFCSFNIIVMLMCGLRFNQKIRIWFFLGLSWMSLMGIVCACLIYLSLCIISPR